MLVLIILALIGGLVLPNIIGRAEGAKVKAAASQINRLAMAVESYYLDTGETPDDLSQLVEAGRLGQKSGAGFYRYDEQGRPVADPEVDEIIKRRELARRQGGEASIERHHKLGKLTLRERFETLLDEGSFCEQGRMAEVGVGRLDPIDRCGEF